MERDTLRRFLFEHLGVRGEWVRLDQTWGAALANVIYPDPVRTVLGEAFAAVGLLSATLKHRGALTLQITGSGLIPLLVAQSRGARVRFDAVDIGALFSLALIPTANPGTH
ncbi:MAG: Hsp33 family molecular chaperone HslO [Thiotrichales bacterium]